MLGFFFVLSSVFILLAATPGALAQKKGKRITGAISSILFIYTSSLTILLAQLFTVPKVISQMGRVVDALVAFFFGPLYAYILVDYGLYVALTTAIILLSLTIFATRRLSVRPALVLAICFGFAAPFAATALQLGWSNIAISRGAEKLGFECVQRPSLWINTQEVTLDILGARYWFANPHAFGRKGDRVWLWSFRAGAWVESDPAHLRGYIDPRTMIRCSD